MLNIVYINNLMFEDVMKERGNRKVFSQAGNNKALRVKEALEEKTNLTVISCGFVNNKSFRFFKGFVSKECSNLIYSSILDIPSINIISSVASSYRNIKSLHKKKKVDYLVFYNYRPETALVALLAKIFLKIKIVVDYEDGYFSLKSIHPLKRYLINMTEKLVSPHIYGGILVTSKLIPRVHSNKYSIIRGVINEEIYAKSKLIEKNRNNLPVLMYSGGLDEERGIKVLLESLKYISKPFKLYISGSGPLSEFVKNYKDDRVEYLGFLDYNELEKFMLKSDILINTQLEKNDFGEGSFPSKIFDYLSTGNLIVSSNVSDVEEFSKDAFYIYSNDNPKELAEKINKAITDLENGNAEQYLSKIEVLQQQSDKKSISNKLLVDIFN